MIRRPRNYYQSSYFARGQIFLHFSRFTCEKGLHTCFICDTVHGESRSDSRSSGKSSPPVKALKERPPSEHFSAGTGF